MARHGHHTAARLTREGSPRSQCQEGCPDADENESRMVLDDVGKTEVTKAHRAVADDSLDPARVLPNVNGLAAGIKWKNGQPTGEPALLVLVDHKVAADELARSESIPKTLGGMQTDVLAIGAPTILPGGAVADAGIETLTRRARPAQSGFSVGHFKITAGTIGAGAYDLIPGGGISPPARDPAALLHPEQQPRARELEQRQCRRPDPAARPVRRRDRASRRDRPAGQVRADQVRRDCNYVDAAVAEVPFHLIDRDIYWNGYPATAPRPRPSA